MPGPSSAEVWSQITRDFTPRNLTSTLSIGIVLAMVNSLLSVALMALIFSGSLVDHLPAGISIGLLTSAVLALVLAVTSGFSGTYAGIQDSSAAILAVAASGVAAVVTGPNQLATVLTVMVVASLATGGVLLIMAHFKAGELARFVPFPVVGGLLAGTGYLICAGSVDILWTGSVLGADSLGLFWPGLVLATLIFIAFLRRWPPVSYLVLIAISIFGFHLITRVAAIDQSEAAARGLVMGPLPTGISWEGLGVEVFASADWGQVASQAGTIATVVVIVLLTVLLSVSGLETDRRVELEVNGELRATGLANLAGGVVGGGPPGYFYLADTLVAHRLFGGRRGPPIVAALLILLVALFGGSLLALLPQFVIGGLLLFVGADFLYDWLWVARRRMAGPDYALMVGIVVVIAIVGILPGVVAGLTAAIGLFVYHYSQVEIVKHVLTGSETTSNIERQPAHAEYLQAHGDELLVLELQGFIFFGTARRILVEVKNRLDSASSPRFVIIDFRLTTGVDSSALSILDRLVAIAEDRGTKIVFTGLSDAQRQQLRSLLEGGSGTVREEVDLDHGVAWCEEQILSDSGLRENARAIPDDLLARLSASLVARTFDVGDRLMTQGDPAPGMFLIASGRVTVSLEDETGTSVRLSTLFEGTVLGEISLYRNEPCTATVTAETSCEVQVLTPAAFEELCRTNPAMAADLHAFVARTLAGRVSRANQTIRALRS